jgi:hypothetical protein
VMLVVLSIALLLCASKQPLARARKEYSTSYQCGATSTGSLCSRANLFSRTSGKGNGASTG